MDDQNTQAAVRNTRVDDRNEEEPGSPVPDPEDEQADADDIPEAD
jgi:hypothetical protein